MHTHSQKVGDPRSTSEATLFRQTQAGCRDILTPSWPVTMAWSKPSCAARC